MTDPKSRPKKAKRPKKRAAGTQTQSASDRPNLDLAVLRALIMLSTADCLDFSDHQWPPAKVCQWLKKADLRQVRGMLLATLERWRRVHGTEAGDL